MPVNRVLDDKQNKIPENPATINNIRFPPAVLHAGFVFKQRRGGTRHLEQTRTCENVRVYVRLHEIWREFARTCERLLEVSMMMMSQEDARVHVLIASRLLAALGIMILNQTSLGKCGLGFSLNGVDNRTLSLLPCIGHLPLENATE